MKLRLLGIFWLENSVIFDGKLGIFGERVKNIAKGTTDPGVDCFDQ